MKGREGEGRGFLSDLSNDHIHPIFNLLKIEKQSNYISSLQITRNFNADKKHTHNISNDYRTNSS